MLKFEKKIINFCENNYILLFGVFISLIALLLRFSLLNFESGDYESFLSPWFDYLSQNGGLAALKNYPGDYNAPYMTLLALATYLPFNKLYLIKGISIIFDFVLAISCGLFVKSLLKEKKMDNKLKFLIPYSIVLFLPNVILNGSMWGQCDSIYTSFIILSLYFLIKDKYIKSFIMLGISFAFKLQFVFILPLYIVLYICQKKYSILHFFIIPFTNLVLCLPAIIAGKPIKDLLLVYFSQTQTYQKHLVMNFPNIYNIFPANSDIFYQFGEILAIALCAFMLFYILYKKVKFNNEKIIVLGLWTIIILTFFLPGMHERYLFSGEILSVVYYLIFKKNGYLMLWLNFQIIILYSVYLNYMPFDYMLLLSIVYSIVIILFTKNIIETLNEKESEVR